MLKERFIVNVKINVKKNNNVRKCQVAKKNNNKVDRKCINV